MLADEIIPTGKFTQPQLELLRMFSKQFSGKSMGRNQGFTF
jgi:hypothetical protein